jgi:flagellar basal body-associated protein FliL
MADETQEEVVEEPKKQKNTLLLVLIGIMFLMMIGMGVAGFMYIQNMEENKDPNQKEKVEKVEIEEDADDNGDGDGDKSVIEQSTDELIVNIQGKGRTYLKIKMTLVFDAATFNEEVYTKKVPYITDSIIGLASSKVKEEISTFGGKVDFKDELKTKLNMILPKELEVSKILFTTFVMQ